MVKIGHHLSPIYVPPDESLGPAMLACTVPMRRFVLASLQLGSNATQGKLAALAGLGQTPNAQNVAGHRLAHHPKVLAAIREEASKRMKSHGIVAASHLIDMATDTNPDNKFRLKATLALLDRADLPAEQVHRVIHQDDNRGRGEIFAAIEAALQRARGQEPKPLAIEGEFVEVSEDGHSGLSLDDDLS